MHVTSQARYYIFVSIFNSMTILAAFEESTCCFGVVLFGDVDCCDVTKISVNETKMNPRWRPPQFIHILRNKRGSKGDIISTIK